jgi:tRNA G18 (ribose-2'-O)-methylase SpoU
LADVVLEIPQFGAKKSLNVSVCGGIALWYAAQAMGR